MSTILNKLHHDHKNFTKLLSFLENQLKLLKNYKHCDLELIHTAIRYMKEYPDFAHHPLEDVVFKYFIKHYEDASDDIDELLDEHKKIPQLTSKLLNILQGVIAEVPQNRDELCNDLEEYIKIQKNHLDHEESQVYPILSEKLDEEDWRNVNHDLVNIEDPLFGSKVDKNYQELLKQVIAN